MDFEDEISGELVLNLGVIDFDEKRGLIQINI
ncbi:MAG TPA: M20 family metallopeptidase, partial [Thermoanaerobacterales bacterium]|nr:M20 family metallopeptidase [Thermoanaerobacterales bacterium]